MTAAFWAWAMDQDLPCAEKFTLSIMADNCGAVDGYLEISAGYVAKRCGLSRDEMMEALASLSAKGLVALSRVRVGDDIILRAHLSVPLEQQRAGNLMSTDPLGFVYLMQAQSGPMKIGITRSLEDRARTMTNARGESVIVVANLPCEMSRAREIETAMHQRFANQRLRGEWFNILKKDAIAALEELSTAIVRPPLRPKKEPPARRSQIGEYRPDVAARECALAYWRKNGREDLVPMLDDQISRFVAYHVSEGSRMVRWDAAWQTWYCNAIQYTKALKSPGGLFGGNGFEGADDDGWRLRLRVFYGLEEDCEGGGWHPKWGPKPGEPGCKVPEKIMHAVRPQSQ